MRLRKRSVTHWIVEVFWRERRRIHVNQKGRWLIFGNGSVWIGNVRRVRDAGREGRWRNRLIDRQLWEWIVCIIVRG